MINKLSSTLFQIKLERLKRLPRHKRGQFIFNGLSVEYNDALAFYHEYRDIFESRIYHFEAVRPDPVILDAGGCIGMATLYFKKIYPAARITVFEPDPDIFLLLRDNLQRNHFPDVRAVNAGLGRAAGVARFYPDQADGGSLKTEGAQGAIEVSIETLGSYLQGPVDLLKMNIEGLEAEVFEEIDSKLSMIREIIFEYHAFNSLPQSLGTILNMLDRRGFRYLITDATNAKIPIPFTLEPGYRHFNLIYARKAE